MGGLARWMRGQSRCGRAGSSNRNRESSDAGSLPPAGAALQVARGAAGGRGGGDGVAVTWRVWPMRWERAMACSSFLGLGSGSYITCGGAHGSGLPAASQIFRNMPAGIPASGPDDLQEQTCLVLDSRSTDAPGSTHPVSESRRAVFNHSFSEKWTAPGEGADSGGGDVRSQSGALTTVSAD